jgi:hypothetical protein
MAEAHLGATEPRVRDDELVVRMARVKLAAGFLFLLACLTFVVINVLRDPRPPDTGLYRGVELGFLAVLIALTLIALVGTLSPFPLFSVSRAGIRTYSMFGLFGSELTRWSEVTKIRIELAGGPQSFMVSSINKPSNSRFAFMRWLNQKLPTRLRASITRGMTTMPMDEIVDYILTRYEGEIQRYGIEVIVRGDE